jgi:O-antigen/teichoic acid export membrane protein
MSAAASKFVFSRFRRGRTFVALADQALISGSNFATNIVLVRALGLEDFGKYSIAFSVILYANALQMSFVTAPMLILGPLLDEEEKRCLIDGMLAMQAISSIILCVASLILGGVLHLFTPYYSLASIAAIACAIGTYQLQDWIRRYYFLTGRGHLAIISDFISYFVQFVLLAALAWTRHLNVQVTFCVMGLTSAAAFAMGPITDRLRPSLARLKQVWGQCKKLSRDLLVANQVRWFGDQGILLAGTWIVGVSDIGGLRATQSLAGPVNLVLTALENVIPLKVGELLKTKGTVAAFAYTRNTILACAVVLTAILIPVAIFGRSIIRAVYGPAVVAFYIPMLLQLVVIIFGIAQRLWIYFYRGVKDTRAIVRANFVFALAGVIGLFLFGPIWKSAGVVLASMCAYVALIAYCTYHWIGSRDELIRLYPAREAVRPGAN